MNADRVHSLPRTRQERTPVRANVRGTKLGECDHVEVVGYGLCGGGLGAYAHCSKCGEFLWKEQDMEA